MMGNGDKVMLVLGQAFFEESEETAIEHCESELEKNQRRKAKLEEEEEQISEQQTDLKKILYGRFGKSINLEDK